VSLSDLSDAAAEDLNWEIMMPGAQMIIKPGVPSQIAICCEKEQTWGAQQINSSGARELKHKTRIALNAG